VTIGDNVWLGGNTVVCPGVHIGSNVVIGAGSVVTKNIPDWCIAAGNPCKVLRKITDDDKRKLFRDEEIDESAWNDIVTRMKF
jgi:maltose O-acetyltransferase